MAKKTVPQHYWVASQEVISGGPQNGLMRLTLLEKAEDGKGVAGCMAIIKSPAFATKHVSMDLPVRICITRAEPALQLVRRHNDLAVSIKGIEGLEAELADQVLTKLAENGVDVTGAVTLEEVGEQGASQVPAAPESVQVAPGTAETPTAEPPPTRAAQATVAPPTATAAPPIESAVDRINRERALEGAAVPPTPPGPPAEFIDAACIVPKGWDKLELATLQQVVVNIDPAADQTWDMTACMYVIQKYLSTGILGGPDQAPPDATGVWYKEICPHCGQMTWTVKELGLRCDPIPGYKEHSCQGYLAERRALVKEPTAPSPVAPPAPPPPVQPTPPAPVPQVAPAAGLVQAPAVPGVQAQPPSSAPPPPPPPPAAEQPPAVVPPPPGPGGVPAGFGTGFGTPPPPPPPPQ